MYNQVNIKLETDAQVASLTISDIKKNGGEIVSEGEQKPNFWTSLPGILSGVAAIIAAILGTAGINHLISEDKEIQTSPKTEERTVEASDTNGESYTNNTDEPVTISFTATGKWQAIPNNPDIDVPEYAKGELSPDGVQQFESNPNMPCPDLSLGALVVKIGRECLAYGKQDSFLLKEKQTARFLMNDVEELYGDNEGSITVKFSVK